MGLPDQGINGWCAKVGEMKNGKLVLGAMVVAALTVAVFLVPVRHWFLLFEEYVRQLGPLGPLLVIVAYVASTVFLIPGSALTIGSGTLFGLQTGFVVVFIGANLGALCSFLLARGFLREKVAAWAAANPKFRSLDQAIGRQGFKMVLLTRLSPIFPFVLLNYFLGLTAVRTAPYVAANLLGMLPATFLFVYIGAAARDALGGQSATADFYQQILKYVGLAATLAVVVVVTRVARRALREAEQQQEGIVVGAQPLDREHMPTPISDMLLVNDPHDQQLIENVHPPRWRNPAPAGKYNLVVIGAGTAGLVSAAGAAGLGARVALIERSLMGGDCLNVGCVPSKAFIRAARAAHEAGRGVEFGVELPGDPKLAFGAAMERMRKLRADISSHDSVERFTKIGVDVLLGNGRFVGPSTVEVDGRRLEFDRAVIATGARPSEVPIPGLREAGYLTNETVFTLTALPRRITVIGAGPIGCELAQAFQRFGSRVTMITDGSEILPREDRDAAAVVRAQLARDGVSILTGAQVQRVERRDGVKLLSLEDGERDHQIACEEILLAIGRTPNLEHLGLDVAGIHYNRRGVDVDQRLRTSNPKVFAAGDVCSRFKFTHAADAMARIALANALFMARRKVTDLVIPWCTYTDPEIAHVGYYDKDAQAAGFVVATITVELAQVDRAILDGETEGFARVHYDKKTGRILGGTIVARHAGEMIGELTLAIGAKQSIGVLSSIIHPYPTQAEALRKIGDAYMRAKLTPTIKKVFSKWLEWRR
jgi:pyruvate/2-oxoglutarate dehydrogenase complex dihydrolipoamide dehydrogenase (E3) component/uncharacterized membrane protein YdjX (TVP38/TMEM64 family)